LGYRDVVMVRGRTVRRPSRSPAGAAVISYADPGDRRPTRLGGRRPGALRHCGQTL